MDHATTSRFSRGPETYAIVKLEDKVKARTKATRVDKWDEAFSIDIEKANEIELTVYDKAGDCLTPPSMLWVRISDIAEEMRRKKIEMELNSSGWVSAEEMKNYGGNRSGHSEYPTDSSPGTSYEKTGPVSAQQPARNPEVPPTVLIESWFALEPSGRIHLSMVFSKFRMFFQCTIKYANIPYR